MDIQGLAKLTLLDYPGLVACTVFLGGCNFRCPFCHNAPLVLTPDENEHIGEDAFLDFLKKRKGVLDGVCITGGEPLLRAELPDLIRKIRALGYRVKLDTNGSLPDRLDRLLSEGLLDYIAMDIKNSPSRYSETSGIDIDINDIKRSVSLIMEKAPDYEFRTTVVCGLHTAESIREAAEMIKGAEKYFLQNFVDSGALIKPGFTACAKEEFDAMLAAAREIIPNTQFRGI